LVRMSINWRRTSSSLMGCKIIKTKKLKPRRGEDGVFDRQERLEWWDQKRIEKATITLIGAGIGGEVAYGLVKAGVGQLKIFDDDLVELSNLNRQYFFAKDLYRNKAVSLAENLGDTAVGKTKIVAYPMKVENHINEALKCDFAVCLVDNDPSRLFVAKKFWRKKIPVIFGAVTEGATGTNVVVQKDICLSCARPDIKEGDYPCLKTPSTIFVAKLCAAVVLYALERLIMKKPVGWNYREIFLDGLINRALNLPKRDGCEICGG